MELLRGSRADARDHYYRPSGTRYLAIACTAVLALAFAMLGLFMEKPLGYVLILGGVFWMALAAVWFTYRP
jgi:hypothetical protein